MQIPKTRGTVGGETPVGILGLAEAHWLCEASRAKSCVIVELSLPVKMCSSLGWCRLGAQCSQIRTHTVVSLSTRIEPSHLPSLGDCLIE